MSEFEEIQEKLSKIDSLKLKISYIFWFYFKKFLDTLFQYVIFGVNAIFFYIFGDKSILSLTSCSIFFTMSMIFYFLIIKNQK